jgi:hypothetical protein
MKNIRMLDFDYIFMRCISNEKTVQYQSVKELKKDIEKLISLTSMM